MAEGFSLVELTNAPCNSLLEVTSISGPGGWQNRLDSVGIRKGRRMRKIACQPFGGPVVVEIGGSKISLGRGIASRIGVEVVQGSA